MFTFKIKIADNVVKADTLYESTARFCGKYAVSNETPHDISVTMTQELIDKEREITIAANPGEKFSDAYLERTALHRRVIEGLTARGVMMLHGSALAVDGEAYIFTAKSGTGKSTHTRLWREYYGDRVVMVNDDKPLISFKEGRAYAHGTPWNGKHGIDTNISVPIKAICVLERAEENHIEPITASDALPYLYVQIYRPKKPEGLVKTLSHIDALLKSVSVYRLGCNMDIEAAKVAYEGMKNNNL